MRAGDAGGFDAGHLRRNDVHQQRGRQRIAAGGRVGAHGIERPHDLAQLAAVRILHHFVDRKLQPRVFADVGVGDAHGPLEFRLKRSMHGDADARAFEIVELAGVGEQRGIAFAAHVFQNRRDNPLGVFQPLRLSRDQRSGVLIVDDPNHIG